MPYETPKTTRNKPHQCFLCEYYTFKLKPPVCELMVRDVTDPYEPIRCSRFRGI